jgi:putative toxin-antitoxin system antitoxin component (TIGR02293 family)
MAELLESVSAVEILKVLGASRLAKKSGSAATELRAAVRRGLPFAAFQALLKGLGLPQRVLSDVLGIPERTIARRKQEQHLTPTESDRLYRVARAVAHASSVLGDAAKARDWLKRPNRALGDECPLELLDTEIGARQVEDVLLRLAHGIHS